MVKNSLLPYCNLKKEVKERLLYLNKIEEMVQRDYAKYPEGKLRVASGCTPNCFRYYHREIPSDTLGRYLGKTESNLKKSLAQKKYEESLLKNIKTEIKVLEKFIKNYDGDSIINTYKNTHKGIKKLISPLNVDDATYTENWLAIPYEGLGFDKDDSTEFYSDRDERMRSKSEVNIANELMKQNIPYKYECPIQIKTRRGQVVTCYPDFTILLPRKRKIIYLEHLGKMGDIDYVTRNIRKLEDYKDNGIRLYDNLIITYESAMAPLSTIDIRSIAEHLVRENAE